MTYYDNLFLLIFFISEPAGSKDFHIDFPLFIYNAITPHFIACKHRNLPPYTSSVYVVVPTQFQQLPPCKQNHHSEWNIDHIQYRGCNTLYAYSPMKRPNF